ncbi:hypothetical protein EWH99_12180 [Sporolactobacillus sp. THM7-7]|nr:hypothetical protein EWH99_12180 [Sporolactobacillus sp. THM7-7]
MNDKKRDLARISRILSLLRGIWECHPNMRFFQFLEWIEHEYSSNNNEFGKRKGHEVNENGLTQPISFVDLFYLEDKDFEEFLKGLYSGRKKDKKNKYEEL